MPKICAIVAMNNKRLIGSQGGIPWHIKEDMKRFAELTSASTVLMGSKTWYSLPDKYRPLPNRENIVASRSIKELNGAIVIDNAVSYLEQIKNQQRSSLNFDKKLWIIGGSEIYKATIKFWDQVYLTLVDDNQDGDAYFPEFESEFIESAIEIKNGYSFINYIRKDV